MADPQPAKSNPFQVLLHEPLYWLLVAIPLAAGLSLAGASDLWIFAAACVAIIPLAGLMGRATENLAETLGAGIGGLLNATFGNAAELIIALAALRQGPSMYPLVKASITGSIIGNVLLVLGLSLFCGGLKHSTQKFNRTAAGMGSTLLALAGIGLLIPTLFYMFREGSALNANEVQTVVSLSEEISVVLMATYALSLVFSLKTHHHLFAGQEPEAHREPEWNRKTSVIVLVLATVGVAWMSELLVHSVEHAAEAIGLTKVFVGVIVVAIIGNAAEHSTAILMSMKNKMDLAVNIAVGSSIQIALFVAPVLVFASLVMGNGQVLDLHFSEMEMVAMIISFAVVALVAHDGESHWFEGVLLLAVYLLLALAFFHLPDVELPEVSGH